VSKQSPLTDATKRGSSRCERFQLFGFGHRRKLVYQGGRLRDALNGEVIASWDVRAERFDPGGYRVSLDTPRGQVEIAEDEEGVWINDGGDGGKDRQPVTRGPVRLPGFEGHPHASLLRALHAELLVNVMPWGPVPNLWIYPRPWYRDAAMMALALKHTGNAELLEPWIAGLHQPFDYNNAGHAEPDNLGQILYLVSLLGDGGRAHPIVAKVLAAAEKIRSNHHLVGLTDFNERPVYQTKWLKYGLRALGLDDSSWRIPSIRDNYSELFWMDYREEHVGDEHFTHVGDRLTKYPYLTWATAHFFGDPPPETLDAYHFPLTREVSASEATYARMALVAPDFVAARFGTPHTWHGAEIFLYYLDERVFPRKD